MEEIKNIPLTDEEMKDWPHGGVVKLSPAFSDPRGVIQPLVDRIMKLSLIHI